MEKYETVDGISHLLCPYCGERCDAEFVDIGVGNQRVTPWSCLACGWVEEVKDGALSETH